MIIFDLRCDSDHPFEGWFQSQDAYDQQLERHLLACPVCGSTAIRRVPSAVHVASRAQPAPSVEKKPPPAPTTPTLHPDSGLRAAVHQLVAHICANTEDVGRQFAEEARKIHAREAPDRAIRGEATAEEFEALSDEGIELVRLPMIRKEDLS